jgi:hypothetical protein
VAIILCRPKSLPLEALDVARRRAVLINPANAAEERTVARTPVGRRGGPRRIAVVVARKWPKAGVKLTVSFLDDAKSDLRKRILLHMNAWGKQANVRFVQTAGGGKVRISRLDSPPDMAGYWSYIGTEILEVPKDEPTLNLEGFTMRMSESEFTRVVRHEAGHTLGFEHEHMRSDIVQLIDRDKAIEFYEEDQGWPPEEVEAQVLTPLKKKSLMGTTESDPVSIMCYHLPAAIMKNHKAVRGGVDINPRDHTFAASLYPKRGRATAPEIEVPQVAPDPPPPRAEVSRPPLAETTRDAATSPDVFELVIMDEFRPEPGDAAAASSPQSFARVFASFRGARVTSAMRLRADGADKTSFGAIIRMHERIKSYTNGLGGSLPADVELMKFGEQLFETLFYGDVRRLYDEARTLQRRQLELVFTSMIPWIGEKPWEFAYDKARGCFLATEEIRFTRNVLTAVPSDRIVRRAGPLRILVASAQPVGFGRLSIEQEEMVIRRGFEPLVDAGLVEIVTLPRATPSVIHGHLSLGEFQVLHFIGHGAFDDARGEGCLIFENENAREYRLGERSIREVFCGRNLSLVFLNACETGRAGRAEFNKGAAQALVAHGLPALVANQYSVLDSSATSFAQHFYWSLAQGMSLGQSAREARIAVNYSLHGEPIDWAVPVLYARDSNLALCERPTNTSFTPATRIRRSTREAIKGHATGVAVWDMDDVFPGLERTLARMSAAQSEFGFELADLSVPLDVWQRDESGGTRYLLAERFAKRVRGLPIELGVDVLACVTRQWLRDAQTLNIYGWWPDGGEPPILIFSVAGFDALAPEGPQTDRVIANEMVAGLAGLQGNVGTHERGSTLCPLFYNEDRDFSQMSARLSFDPACRKKLDQALGAARLVALETLLKTFN